MSAELLSLIGNATGRAIRWNDLVVMNNVGVIPPINDEPGDFVWNRGFNVVVLGALGGPKYFCKCRSVHDERLRHESASMVALHETKALNRYIPPTVEAHSDKIRVLIMRFMTGRPLNDVFDRTFGRRLARILAHVTDGVVDLAKQATASLPHLVGETVEMDLTSAAEDLCEYLCPVGLPKQDADALLELVRAGGPFPRQLQHGDLWPANVLLAGRKLRFLDFEMYGRVQVPMYDVFHFLRTSADRWAPIEGQAWLDVLTSGSALGNRMLSETRRAATELGLNHQQVVAAFVFYVLHFSVTTHRRNPDGEVWKLFFQEAKLAGERGRRGELETVFAGLQ